MLCFGCVLLGSDVSTRHAGVLVSPLPLDEARTETPCRVPLCSLAREAPLTRGSGRRRSSQAGEGAWRFDGVALQQRWKQRFGIDLDFKRWWEEIFNKRSSSPLHRIKPQGSFFEF